MPVGIPIFYCHSVVFTLLSKEEASAWAGVGKRRRRKKKIRLEILFCYSSVH